MNFERNLIAKAKEIKSVEELLAFAKANGMDITEEDAKAYLAKFNTQSGEIADDELDNVSGGSCSPYGDECPKCGCTTVSRRIIPDKGSAWCCSQCGEFVSWDC